MRLLLARGSVSVAVRCGGPARGSLFGGRERRRGWMGMAGGNGGVEATAVTTWRWLCLLACLID